MTDESALLSTIFQLANLVVLTIAASFALVQLRQIKQTRTAEFLRDFEERLRRKESMELRRKLYVHVPHPFLENEAHRKWLDKLSSKKREYEDVEYQIYQLDRIAYLVRKSGIDVKLLLEPWFDVVARLALLLHVFISKQREARNISYAENFCWLARRNLEYIRGYRSYLDPPVRLQGGFSGSSVDISIADIAKAVDSLTGNRTIPD